MATITGAATDVATANLRLTPETYTTVGTLVKTNKDFVLPNLVESYGDQGITGFLQLTGAVNSGGAADQVEYFEEARRHQVLEIENGLSKSLSSAASLNGMAVDPVGGVEQTPNKYATIL